MVQAGEQTKGTISKNKNNMRVKLMRDQHEKTGPRAWSARRPGSGQVKASERK